MCKKLIPYLDAWKLILAGAGKIEQAIIGAVDSRVTCVIDEAIASLRDMYPVDYETWMLPGPNRDKKKIYDTNKNRNHKVIPGKAKEVVALAQSVFSKCSSVLPNASHQLKRCQDCGLCNANSSAMIWAPQKRAYPSQCRVFRQCQWSQLCRGAAKKLGPTHSKRTTRAYSSCRVCYQKQNT